MRIEWTRQALAGLARVVGFLRKRSPTAAARARRVIFDATLQLVDFPRIGRPYPLDPTFRELLVPFGNRGYSLLYEVRSDRVIIAGLKHASEASY